MHSRNGIRYLILLLAIAALLIPVIWIEYDILQYTHGTLTFPLDDAFTGMAMAKTLAFEHVWGFSKHSFVWASSSPLYVILLAAVFFILGAHVVIPLVINVAAAVWFLVALQMWLMRQQVRPGYQLLIMLGGIYVIPIPLLIISGMEYTLELLFGFLFVITFISDNRPSKKLFIYGLLMVTTSYETIIVVIIAGVMLLQRRQWRPALKMVGISVLPVLLLGWLAVAKGGYFIPSSVWSRSGSKPRIFLSNVEQACMDMFDQQYQLAKFVRRYYNRWSIGLNEPGTVSFYSEGKKVDLSGRVPALADTLAHRERISLIMLNDQWFSPQQLPDWNKIASWQVRNNLLAKVDSVLFYTISRWDTADLRKNLHEYQLHLPPDVTVRYY
jgi:hypothetical protein